MKYRDLTDAEIVELGDEDVKDEGYIAIETTVAELATIGAGTCCGDVPNHCFTALVPKYSERIIRCWYKPIDTDDRDDCNTVTRNPVIECSYAEILEIADLIDKGRGSANPGPNMPGYTDNERFHGFSIE